MSGRKTTRNSRTKKNTKKNQDDEYHNGNSRDSQSEDPEIQRLLDKIEQLNEAEEAAGKPKSNKRARKNSISEPANEVQLPVAASKSSPKGKKASQSKEDEPVGPLAWQPAETALLTALVTGLVPVVKLPAESRVTNQYKSMQLF